MVREFRHETIFKHDLSIFELGARGESRGELKGYSVTEDFRVTGYEILVFADFEISGNWEVLIIINGFSGMYQFFPWGGFGDLR